MDDSDKHGNGSELGKNRSAYIALILGGIAVFFYALAWLKFWQP